MLDHMTIDYLGIEREFGQLFLLLRRDIVPGLEGLDLLQHLGPCVELLRRIIT